MKKFKNLIFVFLLLIIVNCTLTIEDCPSQWLYQPIGASGTPYDMKFFDANTGIISTNSATLYRTTNGGQNWILINNVMRMIDFDKINDSTLFAHGWRGSYSMVLRTFDKGLTWDSLLRTTSLGYGSVYFVNIDTGWVTAFDGSIWRIMRTIDGGMTLHTQATGFGQGQIFFLKKKINGEYHGWCSHNSSMYKTTNSGVNWFPIDWFWGSNISFQQITMINENTGWVSTGDTSIWKTTNGGTNYFKQYMPNIPNKYSNSIQKITVLNNNLIYGIGGSRWFGPGIGDGIIWKTTDGGSNWGFQQPDTSYPITRYYAIDFIDSVKGWAYGLSSQGGVHTTNGGGQIIYTGNKNLSNEIPEEFKLYQNYPNPFNPISKIKYQISNTHLKNQKVKLSVYNLLGIEIVVLVNKEQEAGYYEVEFDGTNYPSGVYFYKLTVGEYSETKKMILVR